MTTTASDRAPVDGAAPQLVTMVEAINRTLHQEMGYRTTDGQPWQQQLSHMLQHVVNHASYHRGQVTTMLRQLGAPPAKSQDLIVFYRLKMAQPRN